MVANLELLDQLRVSDVMSRKMTVIGALKPADVFELDLLPFGEYFSTGIAFALTTGVADADTTAVASGDILGLNL